MPNFDDIRPYNDDEVPAAIQRILSDIYFPWLAKNLAPNKPIDEVIKKFQSIKTVQEFQEKIVFSVLERIISGTISSFTCDGGEKIPTDKPYLFISNHRDIVLDAALLNWHLLKTGHEQTEITFGSNLMKNKISVDLGKLNRMFRINRSGNLRDLYRDYFSVSSYIRHVITEKKRSVWIAQRSGRTKDGDDKTESAVLKMFAMSSEDSFVENLSQLSITPVSVSYEYEPCAFAKAAELFVSSFTTYKKGKHEDYESIWNGIIGKKGHVNFTVTKPITLEELQYCDTFDKSEKFVQLAKIIDQRIYDAYVLEKNNYIAYDILNKGKQFADKYSDEDKNVFLEYIANGIEQLDTPKNKSDIENIVLTIYANPVKNKLNLNK
ncbi:MAG: 1-acyl-sn-glycerol-3-phosphate acyltransferase [Bacteroidales bacterium]|nr:1-acyl-sn-glycerol-3-phosphate acyltransferase [Bacteroidales bacterium]